MEQNMKILVITHEYNILDSEFYKSFEDMMYCCYRMISDAQIFFTDILRVELLKNL